MKLSKLAQAINAQYVGECEFTHINIDTRQLPPQSLFIALKGKQDGHDYIVEAKNKGAVALIVEKADLARDLNLPFLVVEDTQLALGKIGAYYRALHPMPLVAITGSCGKTTVKELISLVCQQKGKTLSNVLNYNNEIGVPLTLSKLTAEHQFAVIEMGAKRKNDIYYLGNIAKPNISLITNVFPAHLQDFGSLEGIAQTKGEIYESLDDSGIALLNTDEAFSDFWQTLIGKRRVIRFGLHQNNDVRAINVNYDVTLNLDLVVEHKKYSLQLPWIGQHMVSNLLAATAAGLALNISIEDMIAAFNQFDSVPGRLKRFKGFNGATIFDDTYNANPGSMQAAINVLAQAKGKRIFIMGDMGELGPNTLDYHRQIGEYARVKGIDALWAVGNLSIEAVKAFGMGAKMYADKTSLIQDLKSSLDASMQVLIKGSRSAGMETISGALILKEGI